MPFPIDDPRMKHLVVLMMENRSFDHMLGWLKGENSEVRGALPGMYSNFNTLGQTIPVDQKAKPQG
jgi:phospholipase C